MSCHFLLHQLLRVLLFVSFACGGQLPMRITSQYHYCYEMRRFASNASLPPYLKSYPVDNFCMDLQQLTYHFMSSAQGGSLSFIRAPNSRSTVIFLDFNTIGIDVEWPSDPVVSLLCQFQWPIQAVQIYNDIYRNKELIRQNYTIGRIQKLIINQHTGEHMIEPFVLTQRASVFTEFYKHIHVIFTFKHEDASGQVGDTVLIFLARSCNISDVLVNNNVILRYDGNTDSYIIMTFRNEPEANLFCNSFRGYFNPNIAIPVPPAVELVLRTTHL